MKNNIGLVEHCTKALREEWGYVYGTYGKVLTSDLLQRKLTQYPDNIKKYQGYIEKNYMGKRVTDCVGLIKSFVWWEDNDPVYTPKSDKSANGMFEAAGMKGPVSEFPEVPGVCVWKSGHVGVYQGNGKVIEAKGTKYGVVQTPIKGLGATKWTHWFFCPYIDYVSAAAVYKAIILKHIPFTDPDGVWKSVYTHPYPEEWLKKWAESYKR
jgi:hypothetical protein